jgi:hypothetical protein
MEAGILCAEEVFRKVYAELSTYGEEISLPSSNAAVGTIETVDVSLTRYSKYDSALILTIGGEIWVISVGVTQPIRRCKYDIACDIATIKISSIESDAQIAEAYFYLQGNYDWQKSAITASNSGVLGFREIKPFDEEINAMYEKVPEFVVNRPSLDNPIKSPLLFTREFPSFIAKMIILTLNQL